MRDGAHLLSESTAACRAAREITVDLGPGLG